MNNNLKIAFVFPGQGSQEVGMGSRLFEKYESVRRLYNEADRLLGFPLSELCFSGPPGELTNTINVQPAILLTTMVCYEAAMEVAANRLPTPVFMAGHSVGEYTALVASKSLGFKDALRLTRERGRLMHEAGEQNPGGMIAILGAEVSVVKELCAESGMEISNINAPGQVVISGIMSDMVRAREIAANKGIRRIVPLNVSGPFHSRWMRPASEVLKEQIIRTIFEKPEVPVISNVNSNPLTNTTQIIDELIEQVIRPVQWQRSIENMIAAGVNTFIEIGHGQVIAGLIKRINEEVKIFNIGDLDTEAQLQSLLDYVYNT